ncbi:hypothetical protein R1flu_001978 [Riccia fluitans]|uniref:YDG domain-containing protein n=1 Tax=Riccia fluitans TaxID=41844 RepID=A0ABD1Y4T3_9MARC
MMRVTDMYHLDGYVGRYPLLLPFPGMENQYHHLRTEGKMETTAERNVYSEFAEPGTHRLPGDLTVPARFGGVIGSEWRRGDFTHLRNVRVKIENVEPVETTPVAFPLRNVPLPTDRTPVESEDVDISPMSLPTDLQSRGYEAEKLPPVLGAGPLIIESSELEQSREKSTSPNVVVRPITIVLSDSDSDGDEGGQKKSSRNHGVCSPRDREKRSSVDNPTPTSCKCSQHGPVNSRLETNETTGRTPRSSLKPLKRKFSFIDLDAVIDLDEYEPAFKKSVSSLRLGETSTGRGFEAVEVQRAAVETQGGVSAAGTVCNSEVEVQKAAAVLQEGESEARTVRNSEDVGSDAMDETIISEMKRKSVEQHEVSTQTVEAEMTEHVLSPLKAEDVGIMSEHPVSSQMLDDTGKLGEDGVSVRKEEDVADMVKHGVSIPKVEDDDMGEHGVSTQNVEEFAKTTEHEVPSQNVEDLVKTTEHAVSAENVEDLSKEPGVSSQKGEDLEKLKEQYLFDLTHDMDEATIEELMFNDEDVLDIDTSPEEDGYFEQKPITVGNSNPSWSSPDDSFGSLVCGPGECLQLGQVQCQSATSSENDRALQILSTGAVDGLSYLRLALQASQVAPRVVPPGTAVASCLAAPMTSSMKPPVSVASHAAPDITQVMDPRLSVASPAVRTFTPRMDPRLSTAYQAAPILKLSVTPPVGIVPQTAQTQFPAQPLQSGRTGSSFGRSTAVVVRPHGKNAMEAKPEPVEFDVSVGARMEEWNIPREEVVPVKLEWDSDHGVAMDSREMNINALRTFELSRIRWAEIQMSQDPTGKRLRSDLKVACEMRKNGMWINENRPIGECPGVRVGDCFTYRIEMAIIGLHRTVQAGISAIPAQFSPYGKQIAASVVMNIHENYTYKDDKDMGDTVIYSGQGGLPSDKSKSYSDQKPLRGNQALLNSQELGLPVRLIRGYKMHGTSTGTLYSYDGLYRVVNHEYKTGVNQNKVYLFHMVRLPGQPPIQRPSSSALLYAATVGPFPPALQTCATLPSDVKPKAGPSEPSSAVRPTQNPAQEWGEGTKGCCKLNQEFG